MGAEEQKAHISVELFQTEGLVRSSKLSDSAGLCNTEPTENPSCHVTIQVFYPVVYVGTYHQQEFTATSNQDQSFVARKMHCCEKQEEVQLHADLP